MKSNGLSIVLALLSVVTLSACSDTGGSVKHLSDAGSSDAASLPDVADAGDAADAADASAVPQIVDADRAFDLVDPFIGTGGKGFGYAALSPAAQMPNGLVKLGPDTSNGQLHAALLHFSGYNYYDTDVRGFSHLRLIGTGAAALGNLSVLPVAQVDAVRPWRQFTAMDKDTETAEPGYYRVHLPDAGVTAELTATLRGGFHRYTADDAQAKITLLFNPASSITDSDQTTVDMTVDGDTIEGSVVYAGDFATRGGPFTLYFSATTDPAPTAVSTWTGDGVTQGTTSAQGTKGGAVLEFAGAPAVTLRVGLSFVDVDQARQNRQQELDGKTFEDVRAQAADAWKAKLGRIRVRGGSETDQRIFYTALYNVWRMPTRLDGVDGRYRGMDGEVHQADGFRYLSDMSLWDTFRTLHPFLVLVDPDLQRDCLKSLLAMKDATGYIPRWPALQTYTGSMLGTPADQLFAGSAVKGIDGVDYASAFDALLNTATHTPPSGAPFGGRRGVERYIEKGYLPADEFEESVSRTLEYAWSDWALANLADKLGRPEADALRQRAANWKNVYNPDTQLMQPRDADGTFEDVGSSGFGRSGPYTEGNAWHWRFYPIWQAEDLAQAYGGAEAFYQPLSTFFEDSGINKSNFNTLLPDQRYWHGNEHDLGAAFLFHFAGHSGDVDKWVRTIQTVAYGDGPDGLPGNDDGGTLSAWYVFSAMGFYPIAGGDSYFVGTPLFPHIEVDEADGNTLTIDAPGASDATKFVSAVRVDGEPVDGAYLKHSQLLGTTVHFDMTDALP